jgi:hypothetical protein
MAGHRERPSPVSATIYRGTSRVLENHIVGLNGHVMSDTAQRVFIESGGSLDDAMRASRDAHEAGIRAWGSENVYVQAHGAFGTELAEIGERSMISFTTDPAIAKQFAGPGGQVYQAIISRADVIFQSLPSVGEAEVLVRNMITVSPWP